MVCDAVEPTGSAELYQYWHLAPGIQANMASAGRIELIAGPRAHVLEFPGTDRVELVDSRSDSTIAPYSPRYGMLAPKKAIRRSWTASGNTLRWFVLLPRCLARDRAPSELVADGTIRIPGSSLLVRPIAGWPLRLMAERSS